MEYKGPPPNMSKMVSAAGGDVRAAMGIRIPVKTAKKGGLPRMRSPRCRLFSAPHSVASSFQVVASGAVARELARYADWASGIAMMPEDEVLDYTTVQKGI